jgi:hypothetical protein
MSIYYNLLSSYLTILKLGWTYEGSHYRNNFVDGHEIGQSPDGAIPKLIKPKRNSCDDKEQRELNDDIKAQDKLIIFVDFEIRPNTFEGLPSEDLETVP